MLSSPWGPLAAADAHVHFFSRRFFNALAAQKQGLKPDALESLLGWRIPSDNPEELAREWAAELERHGVERAALIASMPGDEASVEAAVSVGQGRFYGYLMVNPLAADAVQRLQGALDRGHIAAICFFPAMHGYPMHGDAATALLDVVFATRPATLVFVHCGALSVGVRDKLGIASPFDMRYSNPIDLHAVALRFPQLRFVIPHFGAGLFREALMLADLCPNVYFDTSSSNRWIRYEGLDLRTVFRRALDVVGAKRLLFGSDSSFFPRGWHSAIFEAQSKALYELGLGSEDAGLIFGANLRRLMGE